MSPWLFLAESAAVQQAAPVLFWGLAALILISAWAIVFSQNIVRMAVYLLMTLGGVAGVFFMMYAEFLAAVQLIVYAGGTLILIIFAVMLTSRNPFVNLRPRLWEQMVGVLVAVIALALLVFALVRSSIETITPMAPDPAAGYAESPVATYGRLLLTDYLVPFETAAVLLLVVMIGAAYMARRRVA